MASRDGSKHGGFIRQSLAVGNKFVSMAARGCKQTYSFLCYAYAHTHTQARPATTSFSKRSHETAGTLHQSCSGVEVVPPLLFNKGSPLELHSSPVHLATRSLSARSAASCSSVSAHSSTTSLSSKQSTRSTPMTAGKTRRTSKGKPSRSGVREDRSNKSLSSRRRPKQATLNGRVDNGHTNDSQSICSIETPLTSEEDGVPHASRNRALPGDATTAEVTMVGEEKQGVTMRSSNGGSGFNIAEHLQKNVDPERTDGSLSPEINQFLQDISSVVQSMSPNHNGVEEAQNEHSETEEPAKQTSMQPSSHQKSRPKIAAKFCTADIVSSKDNQPDDSGVFNSHTPILNSTLLDHNMAASKIQQWYRQNKKKQTAQVHVRSLLAKKRDELNQSRSEELERIQHEIETREAKEVERQKRRAAKMQAARKAAIEDLKKKREEKRERAEKIAQEEIVSVYR